MRRGRGFALISGTTPITGSPTCSSWRGLRTGRSTARDRAPAEVQAPIPPPRRQRSSAVDSEKKDGLEGWPVQPATSVPRAVRTPFARCSALSSDSRTPADTGLRKFDALLSNCIACSIDCRRPSLARNRGIGTRESQSRCSISWWIAALFDSICSWIALVPSELDGAILRSWFTRCLAATTSGWRVAVLSLSRGQGWLQQRRVALLLVAGRRLCAISCRFSFCSDVI